MRKNIEKGVKGVGSKGKQQEFELLKIKHTLNKAITVTFDCTGSLPFCGPTLLFLQFHIHMTSETINHQEQ
jgi:hypothetical protein